jgi:protein arginine kinase
MSVYDVLKHTYVKWMDVPDGDQDIVISSRVRLARNLSGIPFPHLLDPKSGDRCIELIREAWKSSAGPALTTLDMITFDQLSSLDRQMLSEKHLCSPAHADSVSPFQAIFVNDEGSLSAMVNEEDHLRIQCLLPGLQVSECYARVEQVDDDFEQYLDYAFDEQRGYLTACPTNVGTGMRASVMVHLPAITMTGQLNQILHNINQLGLAVRGLYGEGSKPVGNFYQISNQITLGQTEDDICTYLQTVAGQVVNQENLQRERLQREMKYQLEDKVGRAFGILSNARMIASDEALALFSDVRLGVDLKILDGISLLSLNELIVAIRPAHLQKLGGREMDVIERDIRRAEVIKTKLISIK